MATTAYTQTPIVYFHGIHSYCWEDIPIINMVKQAVNHTAYVECVEVGDGAFDSIFEEVHSQIDEACNSIQKHPVFGKAPEVNIMTSSHGGMIGRGIVTRCPEVKVKNLLTFGGPHAGVSAVPDCHTSIYCQIVTNAIDSVDYWWLAQDLVAPLTYWRDWRNLAEFMTHSIFLPDFNNLLEKKNPTYKKEMEALEHLVLFKWASDQAIYPRDSEWFGEFDDKGNVVHMEDTDMYKGDWLGLKTLQETGRLIKHEIPGDHMAYSLEVIQKYVVPIVCGAATCS